MMVVYLLTNTVNGKQYVGQTQRPLEKRLNEHRRGRKSLIDRAIHKYSWEKFTVEVLEVCFNFNELNYWEQFWIAELNTKVPNGYNLTEGGSGGMLGHHHTDESKAKMADKARGRIFSEETREKIAASRRGKSLSPETRAKLSVSGKGRVVTAETRAKISAKLRGRKKAPEAVEKSAAAHRGQKRSQEIRDNMSKSRRGLKKSPEHREKIGASHRGRKRSPEARAHMAEAQRKAWAKRRQAAEAQSSSTANTEQSLNHSA